MAHSVRRNSYIMFVRKIKTPKGRKEVKLFGKVIISLLSLVKIHVKDVNGGNYFHGWVSTRDLEVLKY